MNVGKNELCSIRRWVELEEGEDGFVGNLRGKIAISKNEKVIIILNINFIALYSLFHRKQSNHSLNSPLRTITLYAL